MFILKKHFRMGGIMATIDQSKIRNFCIIAHIDHGKSTLADRIIEKTGLLTSREMQAQVLDNMELERERGITIKAQTVRTIYQAEDGEEYVFNLIDTPGHVDFNYEVSRSLAACDGAILVVDAEKGVQVGTVKHFQMLRKRGIPTIIFVNKMDKENANFDALLDQIHEKLGKTAVPFSYPIGHIEHFDGFVNVVDLKARRYNGKECVDDVIYDDKKLKVFELHNMICEAVAQTSDELLEKFFMGEA